MDEEITGSSGGQTTKDWLGYRLAEFGPTENPVFRFPTRTVERMIKQSGIPKDKLIEVIEGFNFKF